jgi:hypothetical protein
VDRDDTVVITIDQAAALIHAENGKSLEDGRAEVLSVPPTIARLGAIAGLG